MSDTTTNREVLRPHVPGEEVRDRRPVEHERKCEPGCGCVQCSMSTLLRPRYFAGQLLSDVDLRDEQAYQIAKQRLHNRYLHGYGVVCGLQMHCDECDERSVTIRPGYAIGPCGEDILVPCSETLDVIAAIDACKRRPTDCDPLVRRPDDIDRADEHWCITLAYDEQQVSPKAALRPDRQSSCDCSEGRGCGGGCSSGGCGCGKSSNGNGGSTHKGSCGCGGSCECGPVPTRVYEPGKGLNCEPTRVRETYRLGVVERGCATCDTGMRESELYRAGREVSGAMAVMTKSVGTANALALFMYAFTPYEALPSNYQNPSTVHATLIGGKRGMWDLYTRNPLGVPCPDLATVKAVEILDVNSDSHLDKQWQASQRLAALHLLTLGLRYLWEYVCIKLQPPCPPDPCDDRIIIACVTVRGGRVTGVCNFSCRKRAGSFTARDYWLSLFGIKPLVLMLLERLCCGDLVKAQSPIRNRLADLLQYVDPDGELRAAIARDDFMRVRRVAKDLSALREEIDVPGVVAAVRNVLAPDAPADYVQYLDRPVGDVEADLADAGVAHRVRDVEHAPAMPAVRAAAVSGAEEVVLLRDRRTGRVAGVERARPERPEAPDRRRVESLAKEVQTLRSELASLRRKEATTPARKRTAKKATTKKGTAKKTTAKKATTKKATAKRTRSRGEGS